jgi:hypothetical protein
MTFSDLMVGAVARTAWWISCLVRSVRFVVLAVVEDGIDVGFGAGVNASMTARTASL